MMSSYRRLIGVMSAGLVCVALVMSLALSFNGGQGLSAGGDSAVSPWSLARDLLAVPGVQNLDGAQQLNDQARADRLDPSAVVARERSRTEFRHLGSAAAARVAREQLPSVVAAAPTGLAQVLGGGRIERYLSSDFKKPTGITIDGEGHVWVVDTGNNRVEEFSGTGTYMSKFGSEGAGYLEGAYFKSPKGIAYSPTKSWLYVADAENNMVRVFTLSGGYLFKFGSTNGASGKENGQFTRDEGVAVDASGNVWVADTGSSRIQEFNSEGGYLKQFGKPGPGRRISSLTERGRRRLRRQRVRR